MTQTNNNVRALLWSQVVHCYLYVYLLRLIWVILLFKCKVEAKRSAFIEVGASEQEETPSFGCFTVVRSESFWELIQSLIIHRRKLIQLFFKRRWYLESLWHGTCHSWLTEVCALELTPVKLRLITSGSHCFACISLLIGTEKVKIIVISQFRWWSILAH